MAKYRRSHRRFPSTITRIVCLLLLLGVALWIIPAMAQSGAFSVFLPMLPGTYSVTPVPTTPPSGQQATVQGKVLNAYNGNFVAGAQVCIQGMSLCVTSVDCQNCSYNYSISGEISGDRTMVVTPPQGSGFVSISHIYPILPSQVNIVNFALATGVSGDEMRIVLTWNTTPKYGNVDNDLDAYLWVPGEPVPVYYGNSGNCEHTTDSILACMDHDFKYGFGPETVHIIEPLYTRPDIYRFAVHDYAHSFGFQFVPNPVPPMTLSGASVDLYTANGVQSFTVPQNGMEDCWHVFDYNHNTGIITDTHELIPYAEMCQPPP